VPTPREQEIMSLVARGLSNREISELLAISLATVRTHRQNFMEKFALRNAAEITAFAVQHGYYDPN
jgi:DNA-binding NarL/FixJ family response regulator